MPSQQSAYPDPRQLRRWASDPMPFHTVHNGEWSYDADDDSITVDCDETEYVYRPQGGDVLIEVPPFNGEYAEASDVSGFDVPYGLAYQQADCVEAEEDYIAATGLVSSTDGDALRQFAAYWILDEVHIVGPRRQ